MISKAEPSVIETWMQTVCKNGNLRSPMPAILCHEVRRRVAEDVNSKDVHTQSYRGLNELLARGKALLSIISEKNDVDSIWRILDDISGTSPIATLLYFDFVTSMPSEASAPLLTERVRGDLSSLLEEGRELLNGISTDTSDDLLSTIKQHASSNPLAKILYLEMLGQQVQDGEMTERSQARLEELLSQGAQLLSYLDDSQAEAIRDCIVQASAVSPVAAVLYQRLLSTAAFSDDSDDREAVKESIAEDGRDCLTEMLTDGDKIMKELTESDQFQSSTADGGKDIGEEPGQFDSIQSQFASTAYLGEDVDEAPGQFNSTQSQFGSTAYLEEDTDEGPGQFNSTQSQFGSAPFRSGDRLGSLRMEFHDIRDLLAEHSDEFLQQLQGKDRNGLVQEKAIVETICSVSGLKHVEQEDIEEVVKSFSQNGVVDIIDLFNSLRLERSAELEEDIDDDDVVRLEPNLSYVDDFIGKLIIAFGGLEEAQLALELEGFVYIGAFEHALADHNIVDVDVLRLLSDLGIEEEDSCFDAEEFCYLLYGNYGSSAEDRIRGSRGNLDADTGSIEDIPEQSFQESESDDDEFISIVPQPDLHSQRTHGVPRAGMGLSVYKPALETKVRTLKGEIAHLDRRNNDPHIRGSRAWRMWNMERQLAQNTLEAKKQQPVSPQSSQSMIWRQQSSSIGDLTAEEAKARTRKKTAGDRVGPLLTLARAAVKNRAPKADSNLRGANMSLSSRTPSSSSSLDTNVRGRSVWSSEASEDLPAGLVKEIRLHRAAELAAAGGEQYYGVHEHAVVKIQSLYRGVRDRGMVRPLLRERVTSAISIIYFRKMKVSELNTIFRSVRDHDRVGASLAIEGKETQGILDEMFAKETAECEAADQRAEKELVELEEAEQEAEREVQEANTAQERMEKERDEMLAWQAKADRYRTSYYQLKASKGIVDDQDDSLRVLHPDVFREKNQWQGINSRYQREREQYEAAMEILIKERMESDRALYKAAKERQEWKEARAKALKERQEVDAFVLARKFTDPQVSLKERFRAKVKTSADAPRYVRKSEPKKDGDAVYMGVIQVDEENSYEGEFIVVKDQSEEELSSVFFSMCDEDQALDLKALQRAMLGVGRRLNLNEAERLVKSFDTDGNGTIEFDEFLAGFRRMVGMELPHGMGVERFGDGTLYEGEIFEDKRIGIGMYTTAGPDQQWYLGGWHLGYRQGKGIEGRFTSRGVMVPVAVVHCKAGTRQCKERFNPEKEWHLRMLREYSLIVDTARKKASRARLLVQGDIQLGLNRKSAHTVEFERESVEAERLSEQEAEEEHARRTSVDAAQDSMMVHGDKI